MTTKFLDDVLERYHPEYRGRRALKVAVRKARLFDIEGELPRNELDILSPREKDILFRRFGLDGERKQTLKEVGKIFGVTQDRIRQLQNIALSKLRAAQEKKALEQ